MKKLYLVYLNISDELYGKVEGLNFIYNKFEYNKETDTWHGIYAWTTKKDKLSEFMKIHNKKYFLLRTVEEDDDRYLEYRSLLEDANYDILKINKYEYLSKERGQVPLYTTKFEKYVSCQEDVDYVVQIMFKEVLDQKYIPMPLIFRNSIYTALCKIGYEKFYMEYVFDSNDEDDRQTVLDMYNSNASYNRTLVGGIEVRDPTQDQVNLLILLFGKLME